MQSFMSKSTQLRTHIKILVESGIDNTTFSSNISTIPITILTTIPITIPITILTTILLRGSDFFRKCVKIS